MFNVSRSSFKKTAFHSVCVGEQVHVINSPTAALLHLKCDVYISLMLNLQNYNNPSYSDKSQQKLIAHEFPESFNVFEANVLISLHVSLDMCMDLCSRFTLRG